MKKQLSAEDSAVQERPKFEPPALKRLGTLRELTRMFNGPGMDSASMGMSLP